MTLSWTSSDSGGMPVHAFSHDAMACTWGIQIVGHERDYASQAARAAFEEIDRLEGELSRFVDTSDISRINAATAGQAVLIGPNALECLELAARMHAETGGAFDVTVGAVVPGRDQKWEADSQNAECGIQGGHPPVGMHRLAIDRAARTVTKADAGLVIDLGAIGKGYAVDQAVEILRDWRVKAGLVHSGQSTLFALGGPPGNPGWRIAVRNPADHGAILGHVALRDAALSGSGTLIHGSHIIDPRTGGPAASPTGAWATSRSAAVSDAVSTAFMVMPEEAVAAYCRSHAEIAALLCRAGAAGVSLSMFGEMSLSHGAPGA